jgi:putative hydrolase of the HAD superfamily
MTQPPVEAIIFDVGGTLRRTEKRSQAEKSAYTKKICDLLGSDLPAEEMLARLEQRAKAYKEWSIQTTIGLSEADLWSQWMLPEWPAVSIRKLAIQLNQTWREALGVRRVLPEVRPLMLELFRRGYHLGIASNTITSTEVPQMLKDLELAGYFECAVLSCTIKSRKPEPELLLAAAAEMGFSPEVCVYVGNRADLDVPAARRAGFQQVILIGDPTLQAVDLPAADAMISNLNELLDLFPARSPQGSKAEPAAYASLSTMWSMKNFVHLNDFYETALRMGYSKIELNHQVTPEMLAGFELLPGKVSSVHEPCPAVISAHTLTEINQSFSVKVCAEITLPGGYFCAHFDGK